MPYKCSLVFLPLYRVRAISIRKAGQNAKHHSASTYTVLIVFPRLGSVNPNRFCWGKATTYSAFVSVSKAHATASFNCLGEKGLRR